MTYIRTADLTDDYIQFLIQRNGYQCLTNFAEDGFYSIRDLEGARVTCYDMGSARNWLINQYLLIQNG